MQSKDEILIQIRNLDPVTRKELIADIRRENQIHGIESDWNASAESILEAISSAGPLNQRAVKGMLAEATFKSIQPVRWPNLTDTTPKGDLEYDFKLSDIYGDIRVQLKNQRSEKGNPKVLGPRSGAAGAFAVETQKTRNGVDASGNATRFYRAGSFDILAVCLYASTGHWDRFVFTPEKWLLRKKGQSQYLEILQPILIGRRDIWTDSLDECIGWARSDKPGSVIPAGFHVDMQIES